MSAVRMVAYGVLEMKHKQPPLIWPAGQSPSERDQVNKEDFERDQLRKVVNDELKRYGLLLTRQVAAKRNSWRTKNNAHVLYGQAVTGGFTAREILCEGDFKECCTEAAKLLDKLDASQVPDTETGPNEA